MDGWPVIFPSNLNSAPVFFDVTQDGHPEMIIVTQDGIVYFVTYEGILLEHLTMRIPPLPIRSDWYKVMENNQEKNLEDFVKDITSRDISSKKGSSEDEEQTTEESDGLDEKTSTESSDIVQQAIITWMELFSGVQIGDNIESIRFKKQFGALEFESTKSTVFIPPQILTSVKLARFYIEQTYEYLVVPISYYFQPDYYFENDFEDFDINNYFACGIAVLDPVKGVVLWTRTMDLSTAEMAEKMNGLPIISVEPEIVDITGDHRKEIVVCTNGGLMYALTASSRFVVGYPIEVNLVSKPLIFDFDLDGKPEILFVEKNKLILRKAVGLKELWRLEELDELYSSPSIYSSDNIVKISVISSKGVALIVNGFNGKILKRHSFQHGSMSSLIPITLSKSGQIGFAALLDQGNVVLIDENFGCESFLEVDESFLTNPAFGDVTGSNQLHLVSITASGKVFAINLQISLMDPKIGGTHLKLSSLNTYHNPINSYIHPETTFGVKFLSPKSNGFIFNNELNVQFLLHNHFENKNLSFYGSDSNHYHFNIFVNGHRLTTHSLQKKHHGIDKFDLYIDPVAFTLNFGQCLDIQMQVDFASGLSLTDNVNNVCFDTHFFSHLKWLIVGLIGIMTFVLFILSDSKQSLPI
eukprot:TRINITY_DN2914_c2_g3_i1.p1 TRINITY_DN2914_c2_g3~~TRINITY_DN2914_c2_g3_i1.p1  ORF type:complete len:731 (+),score=200.32 TRINITY_DN2914_c2_g3_i1:275-2194(+)